MNPLFQKKALDAWFEQINDPDYAIHQHHSDPGYTTQNGKDYAGRGTTENEEGALQDGIPAGLLSVELGKTGGSWEDKERDYRARATKPPSGMTPTGDTPITSDEYRECVNCGDGFDVDPRRKSDMCSKCMREAFPRYYASADNPNVTPMPSAPAPVDPSNATFFKESEPASPFTAAEEKINGIVGGEGFHYGARVTDGTTLWFRGSSERLSFNPKTGNVSYLKDGKVGLECPVDQLQQHIGKMLKS